MGADLSTIPILLRREIEARIAGPILRAFMERIGAEETLAVLRPIIESLAIESGRTAARLAGGNAIGHFVQAMEAWAAGKAYEIRVLQQTREAYDWDVTRCAYAEMYRELGMADLGFHLSCARDFAMVKGFNPRMHLHRTQTRMEGAERCDFRLRLETS
jgi:hypothetical protein